MKPGARSLCPAELAIIEQGVRDGLNSGQIVRKLNHAGFQRKHQTVISSAVYRPPVAAVADDKAREPKTYVEFDGLRIYKQTHRVPQFDGFGQVTGYAEVSLARVSL